MELEATLAPVPNVNATMENILLQEGSGEGTTNYNELSNKPKINGVTLTGNKTTEELGIVANAQWGNISGILENQPDLKEALDDKVNLGEVPTALSELTNDVGYVTDSYHDSTKQNEINSSNKLPYEYVSGTPTVPTKTSDLNNDSNFVVDSNYVHTDNNFNNASKTKLDGLSNYDDTSLSGRVSAIEDKIPSQATSTNQLADKDFVNSTMNNYSAFFITKNAQGDSFSTKAELDAATVFYSDGEVRIPTRNDYCSVLSDETKTNPITGINPQTRYIYSGTKWGFQYKMNDEPFTAVQMAAINSNITDSLVRTFTEYGTSKQDKIDSNHKLDYSLLDNAPTIPTALSSLSDDSTHRLVTDTEKSTWNGKQNAITSGNKLPYSLISDTPDLTAKENVGKLTIGGTEYNVVIGSSGTVGNITLVLE